MVIQNMNSQLLSVEDEEDMDKSLAVLNVLKKTDKMEEVVLVTHVRSHGYVSNFKGLVKKYDIIKKIDDVKIKNIAQLKGVLKELGNKYRSGTNNVYVQTSSSKFFLSLEELANEENEMKNEIPSSYLQLISKKRTAFIPT